MLILSIAANAQAFKDTSANNLTLGEQAYTRDTQCSLSYPQVISNDFQNKFNPDFNNGLALDKGIFCYWVKFKVQNNTKSDGQWLIDFNNWGNATVYFTADDRLLYSKVTGFLMPYRQRDFPVANRSLVRLYLKAGQSMVCYARLQSGPDEVVSPDNLSFKISGQSTVEQQQTLKLCLVWFFFGVYAIMLLYNLFIYFSIRESSYLYYLGLLAMLIFADIDNSGYSFQLFAEITDYPSWTGGLDVISSTVFGTLIIVFAMDFLKLKQNLPLLYKAGYAMIIFLVLLIIPAYTGYQVLAHNTSSICGLITIVLVLVAAIKSYQRKFPSSLMFLLAYGVFVISVGIFLLEEMGFLPSNIFTQFSMEFGSSVEAVLFSMALADKINSLKRQNEVSQLKIIEQLNEYAQLQENINRDLEEKVEKRTLELKASQKQLLQKEKLAALGELTAGIAHEIQNPLNFVNNFSEVSIELLDELKIEAEAGNKEDVIAIAADLVQNLEKINQHGKRADKIVKGMLLHSGNKELVNLNSLADEYLKLSYHGIRARDKSFQAVMQVSYDNAIEPSFLIAQEFGRTLLNIYNNAFYALAEKTKTASPGYEPVLSVTTKKLNTEIRIIIRDNGTGIPANIRNKIFQPFFTTKPTGEGTGLGLSLSYDTVKAHEGEMIVNTEDGQFTEFIITLPIKT